MQRAGLLFDVDDGGVHTDPVSPRLILRSGLYHQLR
jgi:hypothetical protein